jgi:IS30 family transposase
MTSDYGVPAMSYRHLSMDQRNVIYQMRFQGYRDAEIARCLGCHRSTISRECQRNAGSDGRYFAGAAQTRANSRRLAHCPGRVTFVPSFILWPY